MRDFFICAFLIAAPGCMDGVCDFYRFPRGVYEVYTGPGHPEAGTMIIEEDQVLIALDAGEGGYQVAVFNIIE